MKHLLMAAAAILVAAPAAAHELWIERDGDGPARVYLGEPGDAVIDLGGYDLKTLKPVVFTNDRARPAALVAKDTYVEAAVSGSGDVRLFDDAVFKPWTDDNIRQGAIFHGRAGRSETTARLDFELVPTTAGGSTFTVLLHGQPLADTSVTIVTPDKWQKAVKTDAAGQVTVPERGKGRYILAASQKEDGEQSLGGETVARTHHVTTLTYVSR